MSQNFGFAHMLVMGLGITMGFYKGCTRERIEEGIKMIDPNPNHEPFLPGTPRTSGEGLIPARAPNEVFTYRPILHPGVQLPEVPITIPVVVNTTVISHMDIRKVYRGPEGVHKRYWYQFDDTIICYVQLPGPTDTTGVLNVKEFNLSRDIIRKYAKKLGIDAAGESLLGLKSVANQKFWDAAGWPIWKVYQEEVDFIEWNYNGFSYLAVVLRPANCRVQMKLNSSLQEAFNEYQRYGKLNVPRTDWRKELGHPLPVQPEPPFVPGFWVNVPQEQFYKYIEDNGGVHTLH